MISSTASSNFWHSLHLLYVSVCNTLVAWCLFSNVWFYAAIISLPAFPYRSPFDGHRNMSSSLNTVYPSFSYTTGHVWTCCPIFSLRPVLIFLLCVESLPFLCHSSHLIGLILCKNFCPFNCLIHIWLGAFMTFNNTYKLVFAYFVFRYSALLIISDYISLQFVTSLLLLTSSSHIVYLYQLLVDASYRLLVPFQFSCQFLLFLLVSN
jgi:hypothetical protein